MFKVTVKEMLYGEKEPVSCKSFDYEDIKSALETALYYEEMELQGCTSYSVSLEELKNGVWSEWHDVEGNKLKDYTLWNGKIMLME